MSDAEQTVKKEQTDERKQFFQEGFAAYLDVVRALHLFQTEVADVTKKVLESRFERIKAAMKLNKELNQTNQLIYPKFPNNNWSYDSCDIGSQIWLHEPEYCNLHLGIGFFNRPESSSSCYSLYCAIEVGRKYKLGKWLGIFQNCEDHFNESWNASNYKDAVGLRRPLNSINDLEQELDMLIDDFLKCIENSQSEVAIIPDGR